MGKKGAEAPPVFQETPAKEMGRSAREAGEDQRGEGSQNLHWRVF